MRPIEVISHNDLQGTIHPLRFRMEIEDQALQTVRVDKVLLRKETMVAGMRSQSFSCRSIVAEFIHHYELTYELATCKWFLSKW